MKFLKKTDKGTYIDDPDELAVRTHYLADAQEYVVVSGIPKAIVRWYKIVAIFPALIVAFLALTAGSAISFALSLTVFGLVVSPYFQGRNRDWGIYISVLLVAGAISYFGY